MDAPRGKPTEAPLGELLGRLGDEGRAFVRAELGLVKAIAAHRLGNAKGGAIALVLALFLVNAALITLTVCFALALAMKVGLLLAGIIVFVAIGGVAALLVRWGAGRMRALGGDPEERAALEGLEVRR